MCPDFDIYWIDESSRQVDDVASLLQDNASIVGEDKDEIIESISYGYNNVFESSKKYLEKTTIGLYAPKESLVRIWGENMDIRIEVGEINLSSPIGEAYTDVSVICYLDEDAGETWYVNPGNADLKNHSTNNELKRIEELLEDNGYQVDNIIEEWKSSSQTIESILNSDN